MLRMRRAHESLREDADRLCMLFSPDRVSLSAFSFRKKSQKKNRASDVFPALPQLDLRERRHDLTASSTFFSLTGMLSVSS